MPTQGPARTAPKENPAERRDQPDQSAQNQTADNIRSQFKPNDWKDGLGAAVAAERGNVGNKAFSDNSKTLPSSLDLDHSSLWGKNSTQLALDTNNNLSKLSDRLKQQEGKDKATNPDYKAAREGFVSRLSERLSPTELKDMEGRLDKMESRVLKEHIKIKNPDGSVREIDQKDQLRQWYENQSRIADGADKLTDKNEQRIFSYDDVNKILKSAIVRGENPDRRYDQGANNTCAAESINRQAAAVMIGQDSKTMADMLTTGTFKATDKNGEFVCKVDRQSLHLDREAQRSGTARTNSRDAWGQLTDLRRTC